jgi:carbon storage regulator
MLVLSRRKHEQIVINDNIFVTVVDIRGDKVRLGVHAPKDVPVHRKEVHTAMKREEAHKESSEESESICSP